MTYSAQKHSLLDSEFREREAHSSPISTESPEPSAVPVGTLSGQTV